jgi:hypothetical protein
VLSSHIISGLAGYRVLSWKLFSSLIESVVQLSSNFRVAEEITNLSWFLIIWTCPTQNVFRISFFFFASVLISCYDNLGMKFLVYSVDFWWTLLLWLLLPSSSSESWNNISPKNILHLFSLYPIWGIPISWILDLFLPYYLSLSFNFTAWDI